MQDDRCRRAGGGRGDDNVRNVPWTDNCGNTIAPGRGARPGVDGIPRAMPRGRGKQKPVAGATAACALGLMDMNSMDVEALVLESALPDREPERRPHLTIRPARGWVALNLRELWEFRDLLFALAARDVKLRYKQTALGVVWVVLQPLLTAGVLSFVFGNVVHMPSDGIPYFIFSYAGLMGWNLFSAVLTKAGGSLVGNAHLISKVFFPRLILPLSSLPSALVDFTVAAGMMGVLMLIYHVTPGWGLLLLPVWLFLLLIISTGLGLFATSLMVSYRDVGYVLPVALQILFYATPIAYAASGVPARLRFWFDLNPLSALFEAIRWSVFGTGSLNVERVLIATVIAAGVITAGMFAFKKMEQRFADVI